MNTDRRNLSQQVTQMTIYEHYYNGKYEQNSRAKSCFWKTHFQSETYDAKSYYQNTNYRLKLCVDELDLS